MRDYSPSIVVLEEKLLKMVNDLLVADGERRPMCAYECRAKYRPPYADPVDRFNIGELARLVSGSPDADAMISCEQAKERLQLAVCETGMAVQVTYKRAGVTKWEQFVGCAPRHPRVNMTALFARLEDLGKYSVLAISFNERLNLGSLA